MPERLGRFAFLEVKQECWFGSCLPFCVACDTWRTKTQEPNQHGWVFQGWEVVLQGWEVGFLETLSRMGGRFSGGLFALLVGLGAGDGMVGNSRIMEIDSAFSFEFPTL